jgi:hypothetical protein
MRTYIVFIHGLGGQPGWDEGTLLRAWTEALGYSCLGPLDQPEIRMAWWAGHERKAIQDALSSLGLRGLQLMDAARQWMASNANQAASGVMNGYIERNFPAIDLYFEDSPDGRAFRTNVRDVLETALRTEVPQDSRICLISHSMGTVVAYDVLRTWQSTMPLLLVTMGSPLGQSFVGQNLKRLHGDTIFPSGVRVWLNVYDRMDAIAVPFAKLATSYPTPLAFGTTTDGRVSHANVVHDIQIRDNFSNSGHRDPHHWVGYLSCQEVGNAVAQFLCGGSMMATPQPLTFTVGVVTTNEAFGQRLADDLLPRQMRVEAFRTAEDLLQGMNSVYLDGIVLDGLASGARASDDITALAKRIAEKTPTVLLSPEPQLELASSSAGRALVMKRPPSPDRLVLELRRLAALQRT